MTSRAKIVLRGGSLVCAPVPFTHSGLRVPVTGSAQGSPHARSPSLALTRSSGRAPPRGYPTYPLRRVRTHFFGQYLPQEGLVRGSCPGAPFPRGGSPPPITAIFVRFSHLQPCAREGPLVEVRVATLVTSTPPSLEAGPHLPPGKGHLPRASASTLPAPMAPIAGSTRAASQGYPPIPLKGLDPPATRRTDVPGEPRSRQRRERRTRGACLRCVAHPPQRDA